STADYDEWRVAGRCNTPRLATLVDQMVDRAALPPRVQLALSWLGHQPYVPPLKVFAASVCPRRSFFRLWSRAMQEPPGEFLDRLRALQAQSLLSRGATLEEAVQASGCRSLCALRHLLARWH